MKTRCALVGALAIALGSQLASADDAPETVEISAVCAGTRDRDALTDQERAAAKQLLARTLERENLLVVETGCTEAYLVWHERSGSKLIVHMTGPGGSLRWNDGSIEKLPEIYRDIVRALIAAEAKAKQAKPAADIANQPKPAADIANQPKPAADIANQAPKPAQLAEPFADPGPTRPRSRSRSESCSAANRCRTASTAWSRAAS